MAICEVAPALCSFFDNNSFAKFTESQTYFSENSALNSATKQDYYKL